MRVMSQQILIFTAAKQRRPPGSRPEGFVNTVGGLDLEWVINVKENQPELLAEAQRLTSGPAKMPPSPHPEELQLWHAPEVYWPVADRSLRVVKTFRVQKVCRVQVLRQQTVSIAKGLSTGSSSPPSRPTDPRASGKPMK